MAQTYTLFINMVVKTAIKMVACFQQTLSPIQYLLKLSLNKKQKNQSGKEPATQTQLHSVHAPIKLKHSCIYVNLISKEDVTYRIDTCNPSNMEGGLIYRYFVKKRNRHGFGYSNYRSLVYCLNTTTSKTITVANQCTCHIEDIANAHTSLQGMALSYPRRLSF